MEEDRPSRSATADESTGGERAPLPKALGNRDVSPCMFRKMFPFKEAKFSVINIEGGGGEG